MTKFLLVALNAKYIHSNPAIYSLRGFVNQEQRQFVELAEYTINQQMQDILADIYLRKPTVIGLSCYIWNWHMMRQLLVEIPKLLPGVDIWLGGPEVSFDVEHILQDYPQVTGIMIGEGEATFRDLLDYYVSGEDEDLSRKGDSVQKEDSAQGSASALMQELAQIPGLYLPSGYTPMRELTDMNELPFLYEDLQPFTNKIIYYETSRGCPYRCSYCMSSIDKKVRMRDMSVIKRELQFFLDQRVSQVKFIDRTFNCNHQHAMDIWRYIYENDNGVTNFHFEIAADILREEEIALLSKFRPGLAQLEIGVQSTNEETLQAIHRVMDVDNLEQIVASIHAGHNVHMHLDLIAGLPYENYASFVRSFNRVYGMCPEQLQLGFLKVLKGSEMWQRAEEFGIVYLENPPYEVLHTPWLSYEEVLRLKQVEEMVEIYYNSNQFAHTLAVLEGAFSTPFAMYEALADYYREQGYFVNSPARAYRYQVLLQFAKVHDGGREALYKELLIYDMYLRENLKSRPDFAGDITDEVKETVRAFYRREELERHFLPGYDGYDWKQLSKMTHLEQFSYPVWNPGEAVRATGQGSYYVLFDYKERNPLTYEASVQIVKIDEWRD